MKRFFVAVAMLCAWAFACNDNAESHVYVASKYDLTTGCFGPSTSLGTISTPDGDLDCAPTCLVINGGTSDETVYVSTMCGPYPAQYDVSGTDSNCATALAAWASAGGPAACPATDAGEDGSVSVDGQADVQTDGPSSEDGSGEDGGGTEEAGDAASASDAGDGGD